MLHRRASKRISAMVGSTQLYTRDVPVKPLQWWHAKEHDWPTSIMLLLLCGQTHTTYFPICFWISIGFGIPVFDVIGCHLLNCSLAIEWKGLNCILWKLCVGQENSEGEFIKRAFTVKNETKFIYSMKLFPIAAAINWLYSSCFGLIKQGPRHKENTNSLSMRIRMLKEYFL